MALYARPMATDETRYLEDLQRKHHGSELGRRARIVLLSSRHRGVHEISKAVGMHPINVRKWIHRFNEQGVKGLQPRRSPGRPRLFDESQRQAIVELATSDPETLGLDFPSWSLQRLRSTLIGQGILDEISAETIRQELLRSGIVFEGRRWVPPA